MLESGAGAFQGQPCPTSNQPLPATTPCWSTAQLQQPFVAADGAVLPWVVALQQGLTHASWCRARPFLAECSPVHLSYLAFYLVPSISICLGCGGTEVSSSVVSGYQGLLSACIPCLLAPPRRIVRVDATLWTWDVTDPPCRADQLQPGGDSLCHLGGVPSWRSTVYAELLKLSLVGRRRVRTPMGQQYLCLPSDQDAPYHGDCLPWALAALVHLIHGTQLTVRCLRRLLAASIVDGSLLAQVFPDDEGSTAAAFYSCLGDVLRDNPRTLSTLGAGPAPSRAMPDGAYTSIRDVVALTESEAGRAGSVELDGNLLPPLYAALCHLHGWTPLQLRVGSLAALRGRLASLAALTDPLPELEPWVVIDGGHGVPAILASPDHPVWSRCFTLHDAPRALPRGLLLSTGVLSSNPPSVPLSAECTGPAAPPRGAVTTSSTHAPDPDPVVVPVIRAPLSSPVPSTPGSVTQPLSVDDASSLGRGLRSCMRAARCRSRSESPPSRRAVSFLTPNRRSPIASDSGACNLTATFHQAAASSPPADLTVISRRQAAAVEAPLPPAGAVRTPTTAATGAARRRGRDTNEAHGTGYRSPTSGDGGDRGTPAPPRDPIAESPTLSTPATPAASRRDGRTVDGSDTDGGARPDSAVAAATPPRRPLPSLHLPVIDASTLPAEVDPRPGDLLLFFDGACPNNGTCSARRPAHVGWGFALLDYNLNLLRQGGGYEGSTVSRHDKRYTNNVAEYQALQAGLHAVMQLRLHQAPGADRLIVLGDSQLVRTQLEGTASATGHLQSLLGETQASIRALSPLVLSFAQVPRANNARADALANHAILRLASYIWDYDDDVRAYAEWEHLRLPDDTPTRRLTPQHAVLLHHSLEDLCAAMDAFVARSCPPGVLPTAGTLERAMVRCLGNASFDAQRDFSIPTGRFFLWASSHLTHRPLRTAAASTPAVRPALPDGTSLEAWFHQACMTVMDAKIYSTLRVASGATDTPNQQQLLFPNISWHRSSTTPTSSTDVVVTSAAPDTGDHGTVSADVSDAVPRAPATAIVASIGGAASGSAGAALLAPTGIGGIDVRTGGTASPEASRAPSARPSSSWSHHTPLARAPSPSQGPSRDRVRSTATSNHQRQRGSHHSRSTSPAPTGPSAHRRQPEREPGGGSRPTSRVNGSSSSHASRDTRQGDAQPPSSHRGRSDSNTTPHRGANRSRRGHGGRPHRDNRTRESHTPRDLPSLYLRLVGAPDTAAPAAILQDLRCTFGVPIARDTVYLKGPGNVRVLLFRSRRGASEALQADLSFSRQYKLSPFDPRTMTSETRSRWVRTVRRVHGTSLVFRRV